MAAQVASGRRLVGRAAGASPPLRGLLPLALLLAVWELVSSADSPDFPPPSTWADALARLWERGDLLPAAGATAGTFLVALCTATVAGAVLGLLVGAAPRVDRALGPTLEFARAMPPAAVVPIAALLIGYDGRMKVAVVTFGAIWPILLNTRAGVRQLEPVLLDTARSLHLGWVARARKVIFPSLLPGVFLGVRVAAPLTLVLTLLVEFLTRVDGVGGLIAAAQRNFLSAEVWGLILVAGLFSMVVNALVTAVEAYVFRHRPR